MYSVLLAEDEPAALRYLRTLIESHFPEYCVVGTASNGREALDAIERLSPEVVLTDVKMPLLDGLELVGKLTERSPRLPVVIVSGYDDFEYVRRALNTGVVDYVLKPVTKPRLAEVFQRIEERLRENADARTLRAYTALIDRNSAGPSSPAGAVRLAALRYGAPPSRFHREIGHHFTERCHNGFCLLPGRDDLEALFLCSSDRLTQSEFVARCRQSIESDAGPYHTMVVKPSPIAASTLAATVESLYLELDRSIVLGANQFLHSPVEGLEPPEPDQLFIAQLEEAVINSDAEALRGLIGQQLSAWRDSRLPAITLQAQARKVIDLVGGAAVRSVRTPDRESSVDHLLSASVSFDEFESSLCELAIETAGLGENGEERAGGPSIFTAISSYLAGSYAQRHTVDSVRARFRVSASYLNKLFRSNTGNSFNEYLTRLRIEAAKRLLQESPGMPIKNVAQYVGYRDPFYFSRVFRRVTGTSPTRFIDTIE